jgi:ABC-type Na+ efflux pump permease subunit
MNSLNITRKDLLILFKDISTMLQLFLLPLVFIVLYVGIGSSVQNREAQEAQRPTLPVVNQDINGEMAANLIANLESQGGLNVEPYGLSEAENKMAEEEISRYLVIPADFSASVADGSPAALDYISANMADSANQTVLLSVEGVARDLSLQTLILGSLVQMRDMQAANPDAEQALTGEKAVSQAKTQFESSKSRPLVVVNETLPEQLGREEDELSFAELAVPSMTGKSAGFICRTCRPIGPFRIFSMILLAVPLK